METERRFNFCNTNRTRYDSDWIWDRGPSLRHLSVFNNGRLSDNGQRNQSKETVSAFMGRRLRGGRRSIIVIVCSCVAHSIRVDGVAQSVPKDLRLAPAGSGHILPSDNLVSIAGTPSDAFQHL